MQNRVTVTTNQGAPFYEEILKMGAQSKTKSNPRAPESANEQQRASQDRQADSDGSTWEGLGAKVPSGAANIKRSKPITLPLHSPPYLYPYLYLYPATQPSLPLLLAACLRGGVCFL